jgi:hypothetical protein
MPRASDNGRVGRAPYNGTQDGALHYPYVNGLASGREHAVLPPLATLGIGKGGEMHARSLVAGFLVVLGLSISIPTAGSPVGAASTQKQSSDQCKDGGWQSLTNAQGQPFGNQGRCISYFIHNPVSLADLAGPFSGTQSFTFGTGGCSFVEQFFDATYPGSSAVGSVTLHLDGCVSIGNPFTYAGTFTIATSVGTLAGDAAGPVYNVSVPQIPSDYELTLTVLSGTGAFAGTTGTIHISMQWPPPFGPPVTGSVTVP